MPDELMHDEAGASDNRLTISPAAFNGVAQDWQDGKEYTVTLKVRQVSPGEFTVEDLQAAPDSATQGEADTDTETPAEDAAPADEAEGESAYPQNRAVAKLMAGSKR